MDSSQRRLWDVSPLLSPGMPVWPGDTPFANERTWRICDGCPVNVSRLTLSTHTGAHADAPLHYDSAGVDSASRALELYLGPCCVVDATGRPLLIRPADIAARLRATPPRVLIRTYRRAPLAHWDSGYAALAPETVDL